MSFFTDLHASVDALCAVLGADIEAADVPAAVARLGDVNVESLIADATVLVRVGECVRIAGSGVVAARSTRDHGHGGMAQVRGHRDAVSLIQDLTGVTRADATKQVRLGEALLETAMPDAPGSAIEDETGTKGTGDDGTTGTDDATGIDGAEVPKRPVPVRPWHAVLADAYLAGRLTKDQQSAIRRGLGEPPVTGDDDPAREHNPDADSATVAAWAVAAEQLIAEAAHRTVDEVLKAARTVRDLLDPRAAGERFERRFRERSFRRWIDEDGARHARIDFDDDAAAWWDAVIDAALRPRRGGPRFVDTDEAARAASLRDDPRSNEQLTYDLVMDVFRAGTLADAKDVFGTRQAGVRMIVTADAVRDDRASTPAVAVLEDDSTPLPAWLAGQHACDTGTVECTLDRHGNPLYLGREERLFSTKQKLVLAIRDGGCRWPDCDRPASYTESHHIDHYAHGGKTDVDRGILLCRWHHMQLHHRGWAITRTGLNDFVLHPPPGHGHPTVLQPRLARRYAFGDLAPPPTRFRPAA